MMKIDELVEKVNERVGMEAKETDEGIVLGTPNNMGIFIIPEDATNFIEIETWATSNRLYWKKPDREYLSALIEEFLHTPIKERFPEKKYRVRLIGFNSDNGRQYLTTDGDSLNSKFFACALRSDLKQEFTMSEINQLANSTRFKAVPWFQDLLRNIEPVEDD